MSKIHVEYSQAVFVFWCNASNSLKVEKMRKEAKLCDIDQPSINTKLPGFLSI